MAGINRHFEKFFSRTRWDIFEFAREMGFTEPVNEPGGLSWQQADVLQAVQMATHGFASPSYPTISSRGMSPNLGKVRYLATRSGQGPGKTMASTIVGLWRLLQVPGALVMVTAPTMDQCREVWLAEARRRLKADGVNPILTDFVECTKSRIIVAGDPNWSVKFVTSTREENAQGRHHPWMTWIVEEASGMPRALITQIEGTLSNLGEVSKTRGEVMNGLLFLIGNPNTRSCYFFDCFNIDREHWWTYCMNAEETPQHIVSPKRNEILARKYGKDSDVYRVRVLGEFPKSDPTCIVSSEVLEACLRTDPIRCMDYGMVETNGKRQPAKAIGLDFARYGGDESVFYARQGNTVIHWEWYTQIDPNDLLDKAIAFCYEINWDPKQVWWVPDAGGLGQGLLRRFYKANMPLLEFHSAGSCESPEYADKLSEAFFTFAERAKAGLVHIPNDPRLIQQLCTRRYEVVDVKGRAKIKCEPKKDYMERMRKEAGSTDTVGKSPDRADAFVQCYYDNFMVEGMMSRKTG